MLARATETELQPPPHRWDGCADPALPALDLVAAERRIARSTRGVALSNSFGFGGNNCALVFGEERV